MRNRTRYTLATTVAASAGQTVTNNSLTSSGGMGSLAEGESHTPMSSPTQGASPLYQILVLVMTTTSFQESLHTELAAPLLIEQRR